MKILLLESCKIRHQLSREALIAACREGGADVDANAPVYVFLSDKDDPIYIVEDYNDYVFWSDVLFTPADRDGLIAMVERFKAVEELKEEVGHAKDRWIGWDWCHDPGVCKCDHGETPYTDSPMSVDELMAVGHTEECATGIAAAQKAYEKQVEAATVRASEFGDEMIRALEEGDDATALEAADYACKTEAEYGDCPVWGDVRSKLKLFLAQREVTV